MLFIKNLVKQRSFFTNTFICAFSFLITSISAHAGIEADIQAMLDSQEYEAALLSLNSELKSKANKRNEKLMLLKGRTLIKLNDLNAAEKYYKKLKRTLQINPEPANKLALIYSLQGNHNKAIKTFNTVIRDYPNYVPAYNNFGDLYLKRAQEKYQNGAKQTDSELLKRKVALSQDVYSFETQTQNTQSKSKQPEVMAPQKTAPVAKAGKSTSPGKATILRLQSWVNTWMSQKPNDFLANYSAEFSPENGETQKDWIARKRQELQNASFIKVSLTEIKINVNADNTVTTNFKQQYESNRSSFVTNKTLTLRKNKHDWLIISEVAASN